MQLAAIDLKGLRGPWPEFGRGQGAVQCSALSSAQTLGVQPSGPTTALWACMVTQGLDIHMSCAFVTYMRLGRAALSGLGRALGHWGGRHLHGRAVQWVQASLEPQKAKPPFLLAPLILRFCSLSLPQAKTACCLRKGLTGRVLRTSSSTNCLCLRVSGCSSSSCMKLTLKSNACSSRREGAAAVGPRPSNTLKTRILLMKPGWDG